MDGQLNHPHGVTVSAAASEAFVADCDNHRIQVFTLGGQFVRGWGARGTADGAFQYPVAVALSSNGDMIYVIDNGNYRVQVFQLDGTFVRAWDTFGTGDGQFQSPRGIAVTANGKVFVADLMQIPSHGFHIDGVFLRVFASHRPRGLALLNVGHVVATDVELKCIHVFQTDGTPVRTWGSAGAGLGQFLSISGVAVSVLGEVFVSDSINSEVQVFTEDGKFLRQFPVPEIEGCMHLAIAPDGRLLVSAVSPPRIVLLE